MFLINITNNNQIQMYHKETEVITQYVYGLIFVLKCLPHRLENTGINNKIGTEKKIILYKTKKNRSRKILNLITEMRFHYHNERVWYTTMFPYTQ